MYVNGHKSLHYTPGLGAFSFGELFQARSSLGTMFIKILTTSASWMQSLQWLMSENALLHMPSKDFITPSGIRTGNLGLCI